MTPDQAPSRPAGWSRICWWLRREQAALGWMYLTVEGIDIESEPDLERYLRALDAFGEVAAGRQCRYCRTSCPPYVRHPGRGRRADCPW